MLPNFDPRLGFFKSFAIRERRDDDSSKKFLCVDPAPFKIVYPAVPLILVQGATVGKIVQIKMVVLRTHWVRALNDRPHFLLRLVFLTLRIDELKHIVFS